MSAVVAGSNSKGEKSKKFQSLNINTIYQVSLFSRNSPRMQES
jgi:hypothetical protein